MYRGGPWPPLSEQLTKNLIIFPMIVGNLLSTIFFNSIYHCLPLKKTSVLGNFSGVFCSYCALLELRSCMISVDAVLEGGGDSKYKALHRHLILKL